MAKTSVHYVKICSQSVTSWNNFSNDCFNFLSNYQFLTDSYVLDFFSEDLWQTIPPQWGEAMQLFSPQQLSALLHPPSCQSSRSNRVGAVLPLSLLAFRSAAFAYTLPREAVSSPFSLLEYMKQCCPISNWPTDAEGTINSLPSKVSQSNHVNSANSQTNHICSVSPQKSDVDQELLCNHSSSKLKMPLHISGSSDVSEGFHSSEIASENSPIEVKPIDGTTKCYICSNTSDANLAEGCLSISPSNVIGETLGRTGNLMSNCLHSKHCNGTSQIGPARTRCSSTSAPNVSEELANECFRLSLDKDENYTTKNSELLCSSEEEFICDELNEIGSAPSSGNNRHTVNNVGNSDAELFFKENKRKNTLKAKLKLPHYLVNDSNTEGICSLEKITSTELSSQSYLERSLCSADNMDLRRKRRWTCNKNKDLVPAWPATNVDSIVWGTSDSELTKAGGQHRLLSHVFRRHVKPKKQHEVARLALIAALASAATRSDVTSDVGSGCGHLARLMAYGHRLKVVCVDKEEDFVKGARQFDDQLEKSMSKLKPRHASRGPPREDLHLHDRGVNDRYRLPAGPRHAACHLQLGGDVHTFAQTVLSCWPDLFTTHARIHHAELSGPQAAGSDNGDFADCLKCQHSESVDECCSSLGRERARRFGLTGLHTCGDLAATLLDVFLRAPHCRYLASVACCYMKLITPLEASHEGAQPGYPLSQHCRQQPHQTVSYAARELACHANEAYRDRLMLGADNLKVHCYRAALEAIIVKHWPHHKRAGLRSVKNAHTKPFHEYAVSAISALDEGRLQLPEADLNSPDTLDRLNRWRQVVVFYTLRLLLAPVIETVLLLDRSFYLYEQGVDSVLVPTFDPKLSPRNMVLLAIKTDKH